jgi:thymidine phosphorylase
VTEHSGYISSIDAETIGRASVQIGAGRPVKGAPVDHSVGFVLHAKIGDRVEPGTSLMTIHARNHDDVQAVLPSLISAYSIVPDQVTPPPTVIEVIK